MAVTFQYRTAFTGLTITGTVHRDALGDAVGTALTFTENSNRTGVYTASATVTSGAAYVRIAGDLADSIDIIVPSDGGTVVFGSNQSPIAVGTDGSVTSGSETVEIINSVVVPVAVAQASQTRGQITCITHKTLRFTPSLLGNITGRSKLFFTVKSNPTDADSAALIQVEETDGLIVANANSSGLTAVHGSITVVNQTTGEVSVMVDESITALLTASEDRLNAAYWDMTVINGGVVSAPVSGRFVIVDGVTHAIE